MRPAWASLITNCPPGEAPSFQVTKELSPKRFRLGIADLEPENLPAAVGCDPDGDHDRLGYDPATDTGFAVGRVNEHVRVGGVIEPAFTELGDIFVKISADAGDFRF